VLWLPWLMVIWQVVREGKREPRRPLAEWRVPVLIAALGGWVLVQIVATAYARGAGAQYPASRYMDTLAFGAMANAVAAAWLASQPASRLRASFHHVLAGVWIVALGLGLREVTTLSFDSQLPSAREYYDKAEGNMRRYLGTNNPKELAYPDIPFPDANALVERLGKPSLRALMPVPIRTPLELKSAGDSPSFRENDARGADSAQPPRAGLSPPTPPLDWTKTWGSFDAAGTVGTWTSAPITATLRGWLIFETAGQVGDPNEGVRLELRDARTDALLAEVRPDRVPGNSWRAAYVRTPRQPFVIVAHDGHAARWLAFSGPSEMGVLSYWAWRATKAGWVLVYLAASASVVLGIIALRSRERSGDGSAAVEASTARSSATKPHVA
jgi:hypothetical protein